MVLSGDLRFTRMHKGYGDKMPQIDPFIRRKPLSAIGLVWIVPVLGIVVVWIYRYYVFSRISPPSKGTVLNDMIQLKLFNPRPHDRSLVAPMNDSHIAKRLARGKGRIELIGPHKERWIYRYRRALRVSGEAHLDRMKRDVAALNEEEC